MFADYGRMKPHSAVTFVSKAALDADIGRAYGLERPLVAVEHTRGLSKRDLIHSGRTANS